MPIFVSLLSLFRLFAASLVAMSLLATLATGAHAELSLSGAWSRVTPPRAPGAGYVTIRSESDDRLISAHSSLAERVEIHSMTMKDGVMVMRPVVDGLAISAGEPVVLEPGGLHFMLIGLKTPLKAGDTVPVVLTFERAGAMAVDLAVQPMGTKTAPMPATMDMHREPVTITVHRISADGIGAAIGTIKIADGVNGPVLNPDLAGLAPGGHAFHIHENPACGPVERDGKMIAGLAAGGHFDPKGEMGNGEHVSGADHSMLHGQVSHADVVARHHPNGDGADGAMAHGSPEHGAMEHSGGDPEGAGHHTPAGDLAELTADEKGAARMPVAVNSLTFEQLAGRAIMIHAYPEDPADTTLPKGGGPRFACGVIPAR